MLFFVKGVLNMKTVLRFIACSDLHFKEDVTTEHERFQKGMECAYAYAATQAYQKIDAVYFVGDFVNSGSEGEMRVFKKYMDSCVRPETQKVLMLASHEFFSPDKEAGALSRLRNMFRQEPDQHRVIGGYHFISVSTEKGCRIGEEKKEWIARELQAAAKEDPFKPIFFFQHPHITNTVYGSICWGEDDIIPILMNYPQIIDFSGHSHAPINDPRSIHQRYFTCVGTGSLSYFELDEFDFLHGTIPDDKAYCAQFHIVEVLEDHTVVIKPFDILSGRFFNDGYVVEKCWEPQSFIYTDARYVTAKRPVFAADTPVSVRKEGEGLHIEFGQALSDEERPDSYTVVIKSRSDGHTVKQFCVPSSYYLYEMPEKISVKLPFDETGRFTAYIKANSFWRTSSDPISLDFEV